MNSRAVQSSRQSPFPRVMADIDICRIPTLMSQKDSFKNMHNDLRILPTPMEEIA